MEFVRTLTMAVAVGIPILAVAAWLKRGKITGMNSGRLIPPRRQVDKVRST